MIISNVPPIRIRCLNRENPKMSGQYVLYWMIANRRPNHNFALQRAADWSRELNKPLLILEALRTGYRWASDRIHRFIIEGMEENAKAFFNQPATYYPYLEQNENDGKGLLGALADKACVVVSDDFPCFFIPNMTCAAADQSKVRFEVVDSNGILPMRSTDRIFSRAYDFRRYIQKNLRDHLPDQPLENPLEGPKLPNLEAVPKEIARRWPAVRFDGFSIGEFLSKLPIDHSVPPVDYHGGATGGQKSLKRFYEHGLAQYNESRNQPEQQVTSGISPYLHFGHISTHEIFGAVTRKEDWTPNDLAEKAKGSSSGWWGMSEPAESFLDELITWREVGFNFCSLREDYNKFESLPQWAIDTLEQHASDPRDYTYDLETFENAQTHDDLWNAAQRQLVAEGRIHNYLRMLWGKKILHWTQSPRDALDIMIELNNKYALDGRNPNSYSGIFWVLGRYDRAWGPEREIFGKIRYMSSDNTRRKIKVKNYIEKYSNHQKQLFD